MYPDGVQDQETDGGFDLVVLVLEVDDFGIGETPAQSIVFEISDPAFGFALCSGTLGRQGNRGNRIAGKKPAAWDRVPGQTNRPSAPRRVGCRA